MKHRFVRENVRLGPAVGFVFFSKRKLGFHTDQEMKLSAKQRPRGIKILLMHVNQNPKHISFHTPQRMFVPLWRGDAEKGQ